LVSQTKGKTYLEGVREQVAEERIWTARDDVVGGCRKQHNYELHILYSSPYVHRVIKWRRMRWAGYVALTGAMRNV